MLKLELAAILLTYNPAPSVTECKTKLKEVFDKEYTNNEVEEALNEIQELRDRVIEEQSNKDQEIYAFPDQFFEGT